MINSKEINLKFSSSTYLVHQSIILFYIIKFPILLYTHDRIIFIYKNLIILFSYFVTLHT